MELEKMSKKELIALVQAGAPVKKTRPRKTVSLEERKKKTRARVEKSARKTWDEEDALFSHLWERARAMESGDYFFFRALSKTHMAFAKTLSEKQRVYLDAYYAKYKDADVTQK